MNGATSVPAAARRAALALHGLCEEDRKWMLASLPDAHRCLLAPLLEELQRLGLPPGSDLSEELARACTAPPPTAVRALTRAQAFQLASWLEAQPPQVAARLLVACAVWRAALLAALSEPARLSIQREMEGLASAPALEVFLRTQAAAQLEAAPCAPARRWWRRGLLHIGEAT